MIYFKADLPPTPREFIILRMDNSDRNPDYWSRKLQEVDIATFDFSTSKPRGPVVDFAREHMRPGATVLDAACGGGRNAHFLAENGFDVYGFDLSAVAVEFIKKRFEMFGLIGNFVVGSYAEFPYESDMFDSAICVAALDHDTMGNAGKAIAEMRRVLKPDGKMLLTFDPVEQMQDLREDAEILSDGTMNFVRGRAQGMLFRSYTNEEIKGLVGEDRIVSFKTVPDGDRIIIAI